MDDSRFQGYLETMQIAFIELKRADRVMRSLIDDVQKDETVIEYILNHLMNCKKSLVENQSLGEALKGKSGPVIDEIKVLFAERDTWEKGAIVFWEAYTAKILQ